MRTDGRASIREDRLDSEEEHSRPAVRICQTYAAQMRVSSPQAGERGGRGDVAELSDVFEVEPARGLSRAVGVAGPFNGLTVTGRTRLASRVSAPAIQERGRVEDRYSVASTGGVVTCVPGDERVGAGGHGHLYAKGT